ncbi:MAG TPA: DinB family protein [Planctomycetota bacterium]|nr:DinB family protein [Planctomycetota bacterium]
MNDPITTLVQLTTWSHDELVDFLISENINDAEVLRLMSHIEHTESAWFARIFDRPVEPDIFKPATLPELRGLIREHAKTYYELLCGDLSRIVSYRRFNGVACKSSIADILLHLCTHGFHHRGQIAALLSKLGKKAPALDYITFCRLSGI